MNKTFKQECIEFMKEYDYEIHSNSGDEKEIKFINYKNLGEGYPMVTCQMKNGEKSVKLSGGDLKMFVSLNVGPIQFRHPDMQRFIDVMHHYIITCERFLPPKR